MVLVRKEDITKTLKVVYEKINSGVLENYWTGFKPLPIAFYDNSHVYIIGLSELPEGFNKEDEIFVGEWDNRFIGNTSIKFQEGYIGIWDLSTVEEFTTFSEFYSKIVHEIFHGFQLSNNDKRFANEFLAFQYPFTVENIALRIKEREYLLKGVFEDKKNLKRDYMKKFISCREKRRSIIKEFLDYELGLESIEGTATYVEYRALFDESCLPEKFLISVFGKDLIKVTDLNKFRMSCYSPGMYISLLLDCIKPDWKKEYTYENKYIYDYFVDIVSLEFENVEIDDQTVNLAREAVEKHKKELDKVFKNFETSGKYKVVLTGKFSLAGFDPMNILKSGNKLLHKNFLKFGSSESTYFVKGPVISEFEDEIWQYSKVIFYSNKKPELKDDNAVFIDKIGIIKGKLTEENNTFLIES